MMLPGANPLRWLSEAFFRVWARTFGYDVFISYSRQDGRDLAQEIKDDLDRRYLVFLDERDIEPAREFEREIENALARARTLLVVVTEGALESKAVSWECETFRRRRGPRARIFPVFSADLPPRNLPKEWDWISKWHGAVLLGISSVSPAARKTQIEAVAEGVAGVFRGPRQRLVSRITVGAMPVLFLGFIALSAYVQGRAKLQGLHLTRAKVAAEQLAFANAAVEARKAAAAAGETAEIHSLFTNAIGKTVLLPYATIDLPDAWRLYGVLASKNGPRFLLRDLGHESSVEGSIAITSSNRWLSSIPSPFDVGPQSVLDGSDAYISTAGKLFRLDVSGEVTQVISVTNAWIAERIEDKPGSTELALRADKLIELYRMAKSDAVTVRDRQSLRVLASYEIQHPDGQETLVSLSQKQNALAFIVHRRLGTFDVQVDLQHLTEDGRLDAHQDFHPDLNRQHVGSLFLLDSIALAPNDSQAFIAFHQLNLAGAPESRAGGVWWVALDLEYPRPPLTMEPGIVRLVPTKATGRYEAVYRMESGELRCLENKSLVVLTRPSETIMSDSGPWTLAPIPPSNHSFRAFVASPSYLTVFDDTAASLRIDWKQAFPTPTNSDPPDPLRLMTSSEGAYLAMEAARNGEKGHRILVWAHPRSPSQLGDLEPAGLERMLISWQHLSLKPGPATLPTSVH